MEGHLRLLSGNVNNGMWYTSAMFLSLIRNVSYQ